MVDKLCSRQTTRFERGLARRLFALTCILGLVTACSPAATPTPLAPGSLRVETTPEGAVVWIGGKAMGQTPLSLELPVGSYPVRVELDGYGAAERTVDVRSQQQSLLRETLRDTAVPRLTWGELPASIEAGQPVTLTLQASDNVATAQMRLWIDRQLVAEAGAAALQYVWDTHSQAPGTHAVVLQAEDDAGNTAQENRSLEVTAKPTALPAATPRPTPTPTVQAAALQTSKVAVRETTLTLSAYPYQDHLKERIDPRYNFALLWLDRAAYEASNPRPAPRTFQAVVMENEYLSLTFLPELGGRLFKCVFKPTGQNVFYQNPVLKPSYWGPLKREENAWVAAGGMEWALPVNEHGYEWGMPWSYAIERGAQEASIVLRDSRATDRLRATIRVTLGDGLAYFTLTPRLENPTSQPVALQFWVNAALTLGSASASPNTEFIYPTQRMIVHSTGDAALPGEKQSMSWPVYDGRDLSRYGNWRNWLGVFVPEVRQVFAAAYNHDTALGIVRVFPADVAQGLKLFAFGAQFPARAEYSDDGSEYFEMWGGPCRTFWPEDDLTLSPGQSLQWNEVWWPFAGISGLDVANRELALKASVRDGEVFLGIALSRAQHIEASLLWNKRVFYQAGSDGTPEAPWVLRAPLPDDAQSPGELAVQVRDRAGRSLVEYVRQVTP